VSNTIENSKKDVSLIEKFITAMTAAAVSTAVTASASSA
jgi:hypothetical protein